jgi:hypothetical protein
MFLVLGEHENDTMLFEYAVIWSFLFACFGGESLLWRTITATFETGQDSNNYNDRHL